MKERNSTFIAAFSKPHTLAMRNQSCLSEFLKKEKGGGGERERGSEKKKDLETNSNELQWEKKNKWNEKRQKGISEQNEQRKKKYRKRMHKHKAGK